MYWEGREAVEQREQADRYFGMPDNEREFGFNEEAVGYEDGLDGTYIQGRGVEYEAGWERGNATRRLRSERA